MPAESDGTDSDLDFLIIEASEESVRLRRTLQLAA